MGAVDSGVVASIWIVFFIFSATTLILAFGSSELCARSTHVPECVYTRASRSGNYYIIYAYNFIDLAISSLPYCYTNYNIVMIYLYKFGLFDTFQWTIQSTWVLARTRTRVSTYFDIYYSLVIIYYYIYHWLSFLFILSMVVVLRRCSKYK